MTEQDREQSLRCSDHEIENGVATGKISEAEAAVMKTFFRTNLQKNWPLSPLQKRMQASGG